MKDLAHKNKMDYKDGSMIVCLHCGKQYSRVRVGIEKTKCKLCGSSIGIVALPNAVTVVMSEEDKSVEDLYHEYNDNVERLFATYPPCS